MDDTPGFEPMSTLGTKSSITQNWCFCFFSRKEETHWMFGGFSGASPRPRGSASRNLAHVSLAELMFLVLFLKRTTLFNSMTELLAAIDPIRGAAPEFEPMTVAIDRLLLAFMVLYRKKMKERGAWILVTWVWRPWLEVLAPKCPNQRR
jgi:hypothetical protein